MTDARIDSRLLLVHSIGRLSEHDSVAPGLTFGSATTGLFAA
jgi:hypothetical protein